MMIARDVRNVLRCLLFTLLAPSFAYAQQFAVTVDFEDAEATTAWQPRTDYSFNVGPAGRFRAMQGAPIVYNGSKMYGSTNGNGRNWWVWLALPSGSSNLSFTLFNGSSTAASSTFRIHSDFSGLLQEFTLSRNTSKVITVAGEIKGQIAIERYFSIPPYYGSWEYYVDNVEFTATTPPPPPVLFIPGMAGSMLRSSSGVEWMTILTVLKPWDNLFLDPPGPYSTIVATDAVRSLLWGYHDVYGNFLNFLIANGFKEYDINDDPSRLTSAGCDVTQKNAQLFVFPYDWRLTNEAAAGKLVDYLQCIRKIHTNTQVQIVAHSMGGLVARRAIIKYDYFRSSTKQVITIGSPWLGAPKAVATLLNGTFFGFRESDVKRLAEFSPGVHELLPTRSYFENIPLDESGTTAWPLRYVGSGTAYTDFTNYDDFAGELDLLWPEARPGSAGRLFHDFQGQDDWSGDSAGIRYTHIVGDTSVPKTIYRVRTKWTATVAPNGTVAAEPSLVLDYGTGDETVPLISAERPSHMRAPNTDVVTEGGPNTTTNHVALMRKPSVQSKVLSLLQNPSQGASGAAVASDRSADVGISATGSGEGIYVHVAKVGQVIVRDAAGHTHSTAPSSPDEVYVPGAVVDSGTDGSHSMALTPEEGPYRITFRTEDRPLEVEVLIGDSNVVPRTAVRYQDLPLPGDIPVELSISIDGTTQLACDRDQNGTFETVLAPSVNVGGAEAADLAPPTIAFTGWPVVTIASDDDLSGVKRVLVSTDSMSFRRYEGPFSIAASTTRVLALAEDNVGNRTGIVEYKPDGIPTQLSTRGEFNAEYDAAATISATLLSAGQPLAGHMLVFSIGSSTLPAVTDDRGVAVVSFIPDNVGTLDGTVTFEGSGVLLGSTASFQMLVAPALTRLDYLGPVLGEYAHDLELVARLIRRGEIPVPGAEIEFEFGGERLLGVTNSDGVATTSLRVAARPGMIPLITRFAGDHYLAPSEMHREIFIQPRQTSLSFTGRSSLPVGYDRAVSARLVDAGDQRPVAGKLISFNLSEVSATAITDEQGTASVPLPLPEAMNTGLSTISVTFDGDDFTKPAIAEASILLFQPSPFVVWGGNAGGLTSGQDVTFYGTDWSKQVLDGDFHGRADFKGYAGDTTLPSTECLPTASTTDAAPLTPICWSVKPGAAVSFLPLLPTDKAYISVIVSTSIDNERGLVFGNTARVAILLVNPQEKPNEATGRIIQFD